MSAATRLRQTWTIAGLQLRRVFFARRSLWVYVLALFPAAAFLIHGIEVVMERERMSTQITARAVLAGIQEGDTVEDVLARASAPITDRASPARTSSDGRERPERRSMTYYDGRSRWSLSFTSGALTRKTSRPLVDFEDDRTVYAGIFQLFYLRLVIFFGCLGIFMNLFRGEMLDKTLHFWVLVPARREGGVLARPWALAPVVVLRRRRRSPAWGTAASSWRPGCCCAIRSSRPCSFSSGRGSTRCCPRYCRNLSVLYYVQALTPVPVPMDSGAPLLVQLFMSPAAPGSTARAVFGLLALTAVVLWVAALAVRRLEIDYSTE